MEYGINEETTGMKRKRSSVEEITEKEDADGTCNKLTKCGQLHLEINRQEEVYFANLFSRVLDFIQQELDVQDQGIRDAAFHIKEKFKIRQIMNIDFNLAENVIAYFYCYSTLNAAVARNRFLDAFNNCKALQECIKKQTINVISLGGGPGTDMIGFCSVIQEVKDDTVKTLNLTVVDLCKRWASFYNIIEFFIRGGNWGHISELFQLNRICTLFMNVDLRSESPPVKYRSDLQNADVILLVRVLDILNEDNPWDILEKIVSRMKSGALLLLIDCGARNQDISGLDKIYASKLPDFELTVAQERRYSIYRGTTSKFQIAVFRKKSWDD